MVKTTVILDDDIYQELVKEAVEKYGSTKKLSKMINEKLRESIYGKTSQEQRGWGEITVRLGKPLTPEDIEKLAETAWGEAIEWKQ